MLKVTMFSACFVYYFAASFSWSAHLRAEYSVGALLRLVCTQAVGCTSPKKFFPCYAPK